jgi:hypothetical protein
MKMPHGFVQLARELGNRLCADRLTVTVATIRPTLRVEIPRRNASRMSIAISVARSSNFLQPVRQDVLSSPAGNPQPDRCRSRHVLSFLKTVPVIASSTSLDAVMPARLHNSCLVPATTAPPKIASKPAASSIQIAPDALF